jgi:hypothetical protein
MDPSKGRSMRWFGILLALLALQTQARAEIDCDKRDPRLNPRVFAGGYVHLRMSLDEAEAVLLGKGYKRVPSAEDAGRTFERSKDRLHQLTMIASLTGEGCVDYVASTSRMTPREPAKAAPPSDDLTQRFSMSGGPELYLSRFRALGKSIFNRPAQNGGCELAIHSVVWNQPSFEIINICALLGPERLAPQPLPSTTPGSLPPRPRPPSFELVPD